MGRVGVGGVDVVDAAGLRSWRSTGLPIGSVGGSATAVHAPATIAVVPSTAAHRVVRRSVAPMRDRAGPPTGRRLPL